MTTLLGAAAASRGAVEQAVRDVFSDPAFQEGLSAPGGGLSDLIAWLKAAIPRLLAQLLLYIARLNAESPIIFWITFVLLCLVLAALLTHIGWTLSLVFRRPRTGGIENAARAGDARAQHSLELLEEARDLARRGCVRDALRCLLLAVLALVEERRILKIARGWTHREIVARIRAPEELRGDIAIFLSTVEAAWYGTATVTGEDFLRCEGVIRRLAGGFSAGPEAGKTPEALARSDAAPGTGRDGHR